MSDLLTHWAVFEDCRRLVQVDEAVDPVLRELIEAERDAARLGAITWKGRLWMAPILARARTAWPQRDRRLNRAVAFALGGLTHQACDRAMKPLLSAHAGSDWDTAHHRMQGDAATGTARATPGPHEELSAAYDTYVFRTVYAGGDEEPFTRFLLADNATAPGRALEAYANSLFQGALLAGHAARPDGGDADDRLDGWLSRLQGLYLDVERWVSAYQQPDPVRLAQFEVETAFYRADDPAVAVARALQRGEPVAPAQVEAALAEGANTSAYGQALELGLIYLRRASAFWRGESEELVAENVIRSAG